MTDIKLSRLQLEAAGPSDPKIDRLAGELMSHLRAVSSLINPRLRLRLEIGFNLTIPGNAPGTRQKILMTDEEFDKALAQIRRNA
jgi:hypothetical protein